MLETAITLPVLLLVLFGSLEFGLVFTRYQVLLGATAQAARVASLFRTDCDPAAVTAEIKAILADASQIAMGMDLADATKTTVFITNLCLPGRFVTVNVAYNHTLEFVGGLATAFGVPLASMPLRARVRMRNES